MILSIIVTVAGLGIACMGMKCTNCGGDDKTRKSRIAMAGGIVILIGCKTPSDLAFVNLSSDSTVLLMFFLYFPLSFEWHCRLLLVRSRHHPSLLQPFHPRQYQVSSSRCQLQNKNTFGFLLTLCLIYDQIFACMQTLLLLLIHVLSMFVLN